MISYLVILCMCCFIYCLLFKIIYFCSISKRLNTFSLRLLDVCPRACGTPHKGGGVQDDVLGSLAATAPPAAPENVVFPL